MGLHHQNQHCFPALSQKRGAGMAFRAQLFEGRLALNPGLNLIRVFFSCVQKNFLGLFSPLCLKLPVINLSTERIKTEMLFKLSNQNSNLALTLGYLNPALNNSAQDSGECSHLCALSPRSERLEQATFRGGGGGGSSSKKPKKNSTRTVKSLTKTPLPLKPSEYKPYRFDIFPSQKKPHQNGV